MTRWTLFFIVVLLGLGAGLFYGWVINPVTYQDTSLQTLRTDYKTDYVLMVAEVYNEGQDLSWVTDRIDLLGASTPMESVDQALSFASQAGYTLPDMYLLRDLKNALEESE